MKRHQLLTHHLCEFERGCTGSRRKLEAESHLDFNHSLRLDINEISQVVPNSSLVIRVSVDL